MNKKGQAVFIGVIFGILMIFLFFIALPFMNTFVAYGKAQINQPFVEMCMDFMPYFLFVMIMWIIIRIMRSE